MKAIVLSSGGVDSTTCISIATERHGRGNVSTVTMYYGQKLDREIKSARAVSEYYGLKHFEFDLKDIFKYSECSLLKNGKKVEHSDYRTQVESGEVISSYVPFRNGLMLSVCAVLAQSLYPDEECSLYLGNHASDFAYADCSKEFVEKMGAAISEGTYGKVRFVSPLNAMSKTDVIRTGLMLKTPYELTWSCYEGGEKACHVCASCIERERAFHANGVKDPLE